MGQRLAWLALAGLASLTACESFKAETFGEVTVGQPQVFSRERLLNERLDDIAWLDQQLARPFEQGMQGIRDFREASAIAVGIRLDIDQAKTRLAAIDTEQGASQRGRDEEIADLEHKIQIVELKKKLAAAEKATEPSAPASGAASAPADLSKVNEALADINRKLGEIEQKLKPAAQRVEAKSLFANSQDRLVNPATAERSSAQMTNRDTFEDEFANRNNIQTRKRERLLDDTHDLSGYTLYEMKFDATITPGDNTRQKALVEITIDPETLAPAKYVSQGFIDRLIHRTQEDANLLIARAHLRLAAGRLSRVWRDRVLADGIEFETDCGKNALVGRTAPSVANAMPRARPLLVERVGRGQALDESKADDAAAALLGRCFATRYVAKRLQLALGKYFKFDIEWRNKSGPGLDDVPLIKVTSLPGDQTRSALVKELERLQGSLRPWVATVEPKEYAQNHSEVSSENKIRQFSLALAASSGPGRSGGADADFFNQQQELLHAIRRQPLASSFASGGDKFGWVLGPKFEIRKGKAVFVHSTARYTFGASLVVPGWFSSIKLKACGHWIDSSGARSGTLKPFGKSCDATVEVNLPHSHRPLLHALMDSQQDLFNAPEIYMLPQARMVGGAATLRAMPDACVVAPDKSCEQTLVIEGRELWRNPAVFVGHQKADRVDLLPSMRGVIATFNALRMPAAAAGSSVKAQDLFVTTSTGEDRLEASVFVLPLNTTVPKPFARPAATYLDAATPLEIAFVYPPSAFPVAYTEVSVRVRKVGAKTWTILPGDVQQSLGRLALKVDDPVKAGLPDAPAELELDLAFRFSPGEDWVSMVPPAARSVGYFKNPVDREIDFAGVPELSFADSEQYGDKQRQKLREALRFALPKDEAALLRVYPGLADAMAQRGGIVRLTLQRSEGEPPIALTMERVVVKGKALLQPALVSLANKDGAIVARDEVVQTFAAALSFGRTNGNSTLLPLDPPVEISVTGRKKPAPPKTPS